MSFLFYDAALAHRVLIFSFAMTRDWCKRGVFFSLLFTLLYVVQLLVLLAVSFLCMPFPNHLYDTNCQSERHGTVFWLASPDGGQPSWRKA